MFDYSVLRPRKQLALFRMHIKVKRYTDRNHRHSGIRYVVKLELHIYFSNCSEIQVEEECIYWVRNFPGVRLITVNIIFILCFSKITYQATLIFWMPQGWIMFVKFWSKWPISVLILSAVLLNSFLSVWSSQLSTKINLRRSFGSLVITLRSKSYSGATFWYIQPLSPLR